MTEITPEGTARLADAIAQSWQDHPEGHQCSRCREVRREEAALCSAWFKRSRKIPLAVVIGPGVYPPWLK